MATKKLIIILFLIAILIYEHSPTHAQMAPAKPSLNWLDAGIGGFVSNSGTSGGSLLFSFNSVVPAKNKLDQIVKVRFIGNIENNERENPTENFNSLGFMYGLGKSDHHSHLSLSAGLSVGYGTFRDRYLGTNNSDGGMFILYPPVEEYREITVLTMGIPIEIEANLKITKGFGMGISLFSDLNIQNSYYGFAIKIQLGKLRYITNFENQ